MDVTTRLWLAGAVSEHRDRTLIERLFQHVRAYCQFVHALLVCTDGFAAYPKSIVRAFREKVKKQAGRGRCSLEVWPDLCIATVIKRIGKNKSKRNAFGNHPFLIQLHPNGQGDDLARDLSPIHHCQSDREDGPAKSLWLLPPFNDIVGE